LFFNVYSVFVVCTVEMLNSLTGGREGTWKDSANR
jgi:hypothetical protein